MKQSNDELQESARHVKKDSAKDKRVTSVAN
jgi:hypothetical protein